MYYKIHCVIRSSYPFILHQCTPFEDDYFHSKFLKRKMQKMCLDKIRKVEKFRIKKTIMIIIVLACICSCWWVTGQLYMLLSFYVTLHCAMYIVQCTWLIENAPGTIFCLCRWYLPCVPCTREQVVEVVQVFWCPGSSPTLVIRCSSFIRTRRWQLDDADRITQYHLQSLGRRRLYVAGMNVDLRPEICFGV